MSNDDPVKELRNLITTLEGAAKTLKMFIPALVIKSNQKEQEIGEINRLIPDLYAATAPCRILDARIAYAVGFGFKPEDVHGRKFRDVFRRFEWASDSSDSWLVKKFTGSIDEALMLRPLSDNVEDQWTVGENWARVGNGAAFGEHTAHCVPPIAVCISALKAKLKWHDTVGGLRP